MGPRSDAKRFTFEGEALTIPEWAVRSGLPTKTLYRRINTYGWTMAQALNTPTGNDTALRHPCPRCRRTFKRVAIQIFGEELPGLQCGHCGYTTEEAV